MSIRPSGKDADEAISGERLTARVRVKARLHGFPEREREADLTDAAVVADLLRALSIPRESVLVFRGDRPVPDDAPLAPEETVRVVRIVSGGAAGPPQSFLGMARHAAAVGQGSAADVG